MAKAKSSRTQGRTTKRAGTRGSAGRATKQRMSTKVTARKKTTARPAAAKKTVAKKKAVSKKAMTKKTIAKKKTVVKKTAAKKKVVAKKTAAKKKAVVKKTAVNKKVVAKKTAAKKTGAKKILANKTASLKKRSVAKKTVAHKTLAKPVAAPKKAAVKTAKAPAAPKSQSMASRPAKVVPKKVIVSLSKSRPTVTQPPVRTTASPKVELVARTAVVAPSIPIPVKEVERKPTLEERALAVVKRIAEQPSDFRKQYDESFEMSWIFHDTALEGQVYTFDELATAFRSDEVTVVDSSVMPIYDSIRRHKEAILYVRETAAKKQRAIDVDLLKQIFVILFPDEGDIRTVKYRRDVPQHRVYFHDYAPPDKIAYQVRQTMDWVAEAEASNNVGTLRIAAKAHYDLARIFPFDNSGKTTRLLMNCILLRGGLPAAIVHSTERQRYYEALRAPSASALVTMLTDAVANSVASIEKLLADHSKKTRSGG